MSEWVVSAKRADFETIAERFRISPITARLIRNRDVVTEEAVALFLHGDIGNLHDPALLPDAERAASLIGDAIRAGKNIKTLLVPED